MPVIEYTFTVSGVVKVHVPFIHDEQIAQDMAITEFGIMVDNGHFSAECTDKVIRDVDPDIDHTFDVDLVGNGEEA